MRKEKSIESKFRIGKWIVTDLGKINQVVMVSDDGDGFTLDNGTYFSGSWANLYHLWTLEDAKDGDVLSFYSEYKGNKMVQVGMIEKYVGKHGGCSNTFKIYVGVNWENNLQIGGYMGCSDIRPTTREQRDLLFRKIEEAGYM